MKTSRSVSTDCKTSLCMLSHQTCKCKLPRQNWMAPWGLNHSVFGKTRNMAQWPQRWHISQNTGYQRNITFIFGWYHHSLAAVASVKYICNLRNLTCYLALDDKSFDIHCMKFKKLTDRMGEIHRSGAFFHPRAKRMELLLKSVSHSNVFLTDVRIGSLCFDG